MIATGFEGFLLLILMVIARRWRVDFKPEETGFVESDTWLQWGFIQGVVEPQGCWYIAIGLPFYQVREDLITRKGIMHQEYLIYLCETPTGKHEGWFLQWIRCEPITFW